MTDLKAMTPHELLERVENRNRWFKIASVVFGITLLIGLIAVLIIGISTLQGVKDQLASQKTLLGSQQQILSRIQASSNQRTKQINDLQDHINCIVALFQQPNRSALTITDLEGCQISKTNTPSSQASVGSTPPQSSNSGAVSQKNTTSGGVESTNQPDAPSTPADDRSTLDRIPVLGRVFQALGL